MLLLASLAAASPPVRLVLIGDTGQDTAVAQRVAQAVLDEVTLPERDVRVLAMGDLFYDSVPVQPDCAQTVAARYRLFYGGLPARKVIGVIGNHDVANTEHTSFSAGARSCTADAYRLLGWDPPDSRVVRLDGGGVKVDLVVVDAGWLARDGAHQGAVRPEPRLRRDADWLMYTNHYTWLTSTGKCGEAHDTWTWLGKPAMDLWLNGHAHHLEAIPVEGALAVTSGAAMQMRLPSPCEGVTGSLFVYAKEGELEQGGYVRLDILSKSQARLAPVICTVGGACVEKPAVVCTRRVPGRGVDCEMEQLSSGATPSP